MGGLVHEIHGAVQSYEWGSLGKHGSKVAHFARDIPGFKYDENKPYAEVGRQDDSKFMTPLSNGLSVVRRAC